MDYKLHYDKIIERAKERKLDCYTESHHIIPRCMNGSDDKDNLVNLTPREHFVAHILLVKIYPKEYGLINAVDIMTKGQDERKIHNRMYGWLKEKFSKRMSELQKGIRNSQYDSIWVCNLDNKENRKINKNELLIFEEQGWIKGRNKWNALRNCKNCGKRFFSNKTYFCERKCNTEYKRKNGFISPMKGKKISDETRIKIVESNKRRKGIKYSKNKLPSSNG